MAKFKDFLNRVFYEEGNTPSEEQQELPLEEVPTLSPEEMATFEASISEEDEENVAEMAQKIIMDSQINSDNDEYPDICNVQDALDTVGVDVNHELICNVLRNYAHCDPAELEKDGINRKQAILNAIEQTKQQAAALKTEKVNDEQALIQAEKDAEAACTEAIAQANAESEKAIEEEKARSAAIIAQIRQNTDLATDEAKQQRDSTLESIAQQRAENEAALHKSANLVAETEKQGQAVINKIDTWLSYLK